MKKLIFLFVFLIPVLAKAQYSNNILGDNATIYVYVGTINVSPSDLGNFNKLKVDIFGGAWESDTNGETTYYIANRNGLSVNQVTLGSSSGNSFTLKAYQSGTSTNFYVVTTGARYKAFSIKSFLLSSGNAANQLVTLSTTTTAPANEIALNVIPVMYTDLNGNLGLNTLTPDPAYRLSVNGKIRAKEIRVETGWADYVFGNDYQLPSLEILKTYINQNHHLPEIPSEQEVAKNGINLGEMNKLLLKKIEELTLYLIEKDKEVKAQNERILKLEKAASK
ncbi:hypothetical protein [Mucilaginibacter ginsenosidivorax]|uniref:Uncharacterized protein n=1 Tax=Mucilaginibacter ginsenosidivorax TaxID=862126 RepID=A0A5B8W6S3_9SPHI|nr:hypothetical protein [Mucilaginibacter ginsenosidivorax]QEC79309.1 hypothetical protein FSB76_26410 [Mucilaginibacter ginsenosidivorax]